MEQAYNIDLIDHHSRKQPLGSVSTSSIECNDNSPIHVQGALQSTPEDKQVYLQTASTHGDTLNLAISDGDKTFLGMFRLSHFDPQSRQAIFCSIGNVEVVAQA